MEAKETKETLQPLKHLPVKRIASELWIWLKYSMFLAGIMASVTFIRVNFFDAEVKFNTAQTPLLWVPNAVLEDPTPAPRKK